MLAAEGADDVAGVAARRAEAAELHQCYDRCQTVLIGSAGAGGSEALLRIDGAIGEALAAEELVG